MNKLHVDSDLEPLRDSARAFLAIRGAKTGSHDAIQGLAEMDWLGLLVDETLSGAGWRPVEACVVAEELGRVRDGSSWLGCVMAAAALADAPLDLRDRWLSKVLAGNVIAGFAAADDIVRVVGGDTARILVTVGRNGVHLVELADEHPRNPDVDSLDTSRLTWCIDISTVTGVLISGPERAQTLMAVARLLICADAVGAMSRARERLVDYLKERSAFGAPIASFQAVQHRLVDLLVFEVKSRAILAKAARTLASAEASVETVVAQAAVAHAFVSANATAAIDECMQLSGGIGFTWEYPLHHELRRASADAWLLGTARSSRAQLAEAFGW